MPRISRGSGPLSLTLLISYLNSHPLCCIGADLHLEVGPIPLEADCMKVPLLLGWRQASTTHYNKIITSATFPICVLRAKKPCRFNKSSKF